MASPQLPLAIPTPTLFCFVLAKPDREAALLLAQREAGVGIFSCDAWLVYSNETLPALHARVLDGGPLEVSVGGLYTSLLNTDVFQRIWRNVFAQGQYRDYDWTVKVDPDTAFAVPHLRSILQQDFWRSSTSDEAVYLLNSLGKLWGPIEVLSQAAMRDFERGAASCEASIDVRGKGEDWYLHLCLDQLGVRGATTPRLLSMQSLARSPCNSSHAAFHPFKSRGALLGCLLRSAGYV